MRSPQTHFEQIPLEMIAKIVEAQSPHVEPTGQTLSSQQRSEPEFEPEKIAG
jgi:hypothetical protein